MSVRTLVKTVSAALLLAVLLSVAVGCGAERKVVGKWYGEYTYGGKEYEFTIQVKSDGTYVRSGKQNGRALNTEYGSWQFDGEKLILEAYDTSGKLEYNYSLGRLENGGHILKKIG